MADVELDTVKLEWKLTGIAKPAVSHNGLRRESDDSERGEREPHDCVCAVVSVGSMVGRRGGLRSSKQNVGEV